MSNRNRIFIGVVILVIVMILPLLAQAPQQGGGQGAGGGQGRGGGEARGAQPPPTNLQVLPKDWTRQQVVQVMQGFNMALGVQCNYCHVEQVGAQPNEKGNIPIDGAPDTKQTKKTARVMMRMVGDINAKFGSELGKPAADVVRVQCITCHRGSAIPKTQ
jgi:Photosynthetic reaction centre cytochrome C subunit